MKAQAPCSNMLRSQIGKISPSNIFLPLNADFLASKHTTFTYSMKGARHIASIFQKKNNHICSGKTDLLGKKDIQQNKSATLLFIMSDWYRHTHRWIYLQLTLKKKDLRKKKDNITLQSIHFQTQEFFYHPTLPSFRLLFATQLNYFEMSKNNDWNKQLQIL